DHKPSSPTTYPSLLLSFPLSNCSLQPNGYDGCGSYSGNRPAAKWAMKVGTELVQELLLYLFHDLLHHLLADPQHLRFECCDCGCLQERRGVGASQIASQLLTLYVVERSPAGLRTPAAAISHFASVRGGGERERERERER